MPKNREGFLEDSSGELKISVSQESGVGKNADQSLTRRSFLRKSLLTVLGSVLAPKLMACGDPPQITQIEAPDEKAERKKWIAENRKKHDEGSLVVEGDFSSMLKVDELFSDMERNYPILDKRMKELISEYKKSLIDKINQNKGNIPLLFDIFASSIESQVKRYENEKNAEAQLRIYKKGAENCKKQIERLKSDDKKLFNEEWSYLMEVLDKEFSGFMKSLIIYSGAFLDEDKFIEFQQKLLEKPENLIEKKMGGDLPGEKEHIAAKVFGCMMDLDFESWMNQLLSVLMYAVSQNIFFANRNDFAAFSMSSMLGNMAILNSEKLKKERMSQNSPYCFLLFNNMFPLQILNSSELDANEKLELFNFSISTAPEVKKDLAKRFNEVLIPLVKIAKEKGEELFEKEKSINLSYNFLGKEGCSDRPDICENIQNNPGEILLNWMTIPGDDYKNYDLENSTARFLGELLSGITSQSMFTLTVANGLKSFDLNDATKVELAKCKLPFNKNWGSFYG